MEMTISGKREYLREPPGNRQTLGQFYGYEFDDLGQDNDFVDASIEDNTGNNQREDDNINNIHLYHHHIEDKKVPRPLTRNKKRSNDIRTKEPPLKKAKIRKSKSQQIVSVSGTLDYSLCRVNYMHPPYTVLKMNQPQVETLKFIKDKHAKVLADVKQVSITGGPPGFSRGVLVANDMGCGKTATSIQFFVELIKDHVISRGPLEEFPRVLIICTKTLIWNWKNEADVHFRNVGLFDASDKEEAREGNLIDRSVVITTYTRLSAEAKYSEKARGGNGRVPALLEPGLFKYVIFDESQILKNPDSGLAKSAERLSYAPFTILLSATPLENKMEELSQQLSMIRIPGYPTRKQFKGMDIGTKFAVLKKFSKDNMIRKKLKQSRLLIFDVPVKLNPHSARSYEMELNQLSSTLKVTTDEQENNKHKLHTLSNLRVICSTGGGNLLNDYKWESGKADALCDEPAADVLKLRKNERFVRLSDGSLFSIGKKFAHEPTGKMVRMAEIIKYFKTTDPTTKFLIFSEYTVTLESFCDFINTCVITDPEQEHGRAAVLRGSVPIEMRNRVMSTYSDPNGNIDFLCCITTLVGYGTNLQAGNVVFFVDQGFNPQQTNQGMSRCDRPGQLKPYVFVFRFRSTYDSAITKQATRRETVEQQIGRRHGDKQIIFDVLINGEGKKEDILKAVGSMTAKIGKSAQLTIINDELFGYENVVTLEVHQPACHTDEWEDWLLTQEKLKEIHAKALSNSKIHNSIPWTRVTEQEISQLKAIPKWSMLFSLDISKYPLLYLSKTVDRICFASVNSLCKYLYNLMCASIFQTRKIQFEQSFKSTARHDTLRFSDEDEYMRCTEAFREAFLDAGYTEDCDPGVFDGMWEFDVVVHCVQNDIHLQECKSFQTSNLIEGFNGKVGWAETAFAFVPVYAGKKCSPSASAPSVGYPIIPAERLKPHKIIRFDGASILRMSKSSISVESVMGVHCNILPTHESFFSNHIETAVLCDVAAGPKGEEILRFPEIVSYMSLLELCSYQWRNSDSLQRSHIVTTCVPHTYLSVKIPSWSFNCLTEILYDTLMHHNWVIENSVCHGSDGTLVDPRCVFEGHHYQYQHQRRTETKVSIKASGGKIVMAPTDCTDYHQSCGDHRECNYRVYERENAVCGVMTRGQPQYVSAEFGHLEPFIVYYFNASYCHHHSLFLTILECPPSVPGEILGEFFGMVFEVHLLRLFTRIKPIAHFCDNTFPPSECQSNFYIDVPRTTEVVVVLENDRKGPELYLALRDYLDNSGEHLVFSVRNRLNLHRNVEILLAHTMALGLNCDHSVSVKFVDRTRRNVYGVFSITQ